MAPARDGAEDGSPYWGRAEKGKPAPKSSTRAGALWNFFNAACECDDCDSPLTDGAPDGPTEGAMPTSTDGVTRHGPTDVPQDVESTAAPTGLGFGLGLGLGLEPMPEPSSSTRCPRTNCALRLCGQRP